MRNVQLNPEAITTIAAAKGIDSVSELARRATLPQPNLRLILLGERQARPSHVLAIANALGVKPSELLDPSEAELGAAMDAEAVSEQVS